MKVYITTYEIDGKLVGASSGVGAFLYHDWAVESINNTVDWICQLYASYGRNAVTMLYDDINRKYSQPMEPNESRSLVMDVKEPGKKVQEIKLTLYRKEIEE